MKLILFVLAFAIAVQATYAASLDFDVRDSAYLKELFSFFQNDETPEDAPSRSLIASNVLSAQYYPPPAYGYSYPPPSGGYTYSPPTVVVLPQCSLNASSCFSADSFNGTSLKTFNLSASGWSFSGKGSLTYVFGYYAADGSAIVLNATTSTSANIVFPVTGNVTAYVCVTAEAYPLVATCTLNSNLYTHTFNITPASAAALDTYFSSVSGNLSSNDAVNYGMNIASAINSNTSVDRTILSGIITNVYTNMNYATTPVNNVVTIITSSWSFATSAAQAFFFNNMKVVFSQLNSASLDSTSATNYLSAVNVVSSGVLTASAASSISSSVDSISRGIRNRLTIGNRVIVSSGPNFYISALYKPVSAFSSGASATNRRSRNLLATSLSVSLSSAVQSLCSANSTCSSTGVYLTVSTLPSAVASTVLTTSTFVSNVVRIRISDLPVTTNATDLVTMTVPVNSTSATNTLIRLDDYTAYVDDYNTGVKSTTTTTSSSATAVSGTSNMLGDFAVIVASTTNAAGKVSVGASFTAAAAVISSFLLFLL